MMTNTNLEELEQQLESDIDRLSKGRLVQPDFLGDLMKPLIELNEKRQLLATLKWLKEKRG